MKIFPKLMMAVIWLLLSAYPAAPGGWTSNEFIYKPNLGARGVVEKGFFDSGMERLDARLGKEVWVGDPKYGATLQSAITVIGNTPAILRVPAGTHSIAADLTIPANILVRPERGAIVTIATGKTLTIYSLEAGLYQVFSCAGTGKVVFGPGAVKEVYAEWFGAVGDGSTNDAVALQKALDTVAGGGALRFLNRTYKSTAKLSVSQTTGTTLRLIGSLDSKILLDLTEPTSPPSYGDAAIDLIGGGSATCVLEIVGVNFQGTATTVGNRNGLNIKNYKQLSAYP